MLNERMDRFRQRDQARAQMVGMDLHEPHAPYTLTFSGVTICHVCTQAKKQSTKWWQWWKNRQVEWPCEFANKKEVVMKDAYLRINTRHKYPAVVNGCPTILHDAQPAMVVVTTLYGPIAYVHFKLATIMEAIERA